MTRLKLVAAAMAVRFKEHIVEENEIKVRGCSFWSDSFTVFQWNIQFPC